VRSVRVPNWWVEKFPRFNGDTLERFLREVFQPAVDVGQADASKKPFIRKPEKEPPVPNREVDEMIAMTRRKLAAKSKYMKRFKAQTQRMTGWLERRRRRGILPRYYTTKSRQKYAIVGGRFIYVSGAGRGGLYYDTQRKKYVSDEYADRIMRL